MSKVENEVLQVESVKADGGDLMVTLTSPDREALTGRGRQFVLDWVSKQSQYSTWANAGVDKASGPAAFNPDDPNADPYKAASQNKDIIWHYRQTFRLTKML